MRVAASRPSPEPPARPRPVVLLGFSDFERRQLETVLRLATPRSGACRLVDNVTEAELVVADADDGAAREAVARQGLASATVWVGSGTPLPRPINVAQVVRALDAAARRGRPPGRAAERVLGELALMAGTSATPPRLRLLVATADERLLPPLETALRRAGCELLRLRSGAAAIDQAERHAATAGLPLAVVLDTRDDGAFGYLAARTIRRRAETAGRAAPTLLLLADGSAAVARLRGELAGADAVLSLPVGAEDLLSRLPIMAACLRSDATPLPATAGTR